MLFPIVNKRSILYTAIASLFVGLATLSPNLTHAQGPTQDNADLYCVKPQNRPRSDRHLNCYDYSKKRQGLWKFYSGYGLLLKEANYKDNKMHGDYTEYFSSTGKLRIKTTYFDGKKDGEYASYFFSGQPMSEGMYDYGLRTGVWTYYYSTTGEVRCTGSYIRGKKNGSWKFYYSNGRLKRTIDFNMDQVVKSVDAPVDNTPKTPKTTPPVATTPKKGSK